MKSAYLAGSAFMIATISVIRSWVVHMKVRTPSASATSRTSTIACVFWTRIAPARAFSSDIWLMPKNWLSPNSRRSILCGAVAAISGVP
jgi:hypothetical protein